MQHGKKRMISGEKKMWPLILGLALLGLMLISAPVMASDNPVHKKVDGTVLQSPAQQKAAGQTIIAKGDTIYSVAKPDKRLTYAQALDTGTIYAGQQAIYADKKLTDKKLTDTAKLVKQVGQDIAQIVASSSGYTIAAGTQAQPAEDTKVIEQVIAKITQTAGAPSGA